MLDNDPRTNEEIEAYKQRYKRITEIYHDIDMILTLIAMSILTFSVLGAIHYARHIF